MEKIPAGILQDLVKKRVREIGGMDVGSVRPARVESRPRVSSGNDDQFGSVLAQRLISMLLKAPNLWQTLNGEVQADLLAHQREFGVLGRLVSLLNAQPEADTNEILIAWPEDVEQQKLIELAKKPMASNAQAWQQELLDGSTHLLRQRERSMRQQRIAELKAAGEEDKLRDLLPSKTRFRDSDG